MAKFEFRPIENLGLSEVEVAWLLKSIEKFFQEIDEASIFEVTLERFLSTLELSHIQSPMEKIFILEIILLVLVREGFLVDFKSVEKNFLDKFTDIDGAETNGRYYFIPFNDCND